MSGTTQPDGDLPTALRHLADAVHNLCSPLSRLINNRIVHIPSRYLQLQDATEGEQSNTGGGGGSKSRPPFWTDAFDCLNEIDTTIAIWQPALSGVPATVGRIRGLQARSWRPQDVKQIGQITDALKDWATEIDALLDPQPVVYLMAPNPSTEPAACTSCGTRRVYRKDSTGERVRQPALRVTKDGCRCQHCHASWEPGQLRILAAALGYPLPSGVLE